ARTAIGAREKASACRASELRAFQPRRADTRPTSPREAHALARSPEHDILPTQAVGGINTSGVSIWSVPVRRGYERGRRRRGVPAVVQRAKGHAAARRSGACRDEEVLRR